MQSSVKTFDGKIIKLTKLNHNNFFSNYIVLHLLQPN